MNKNKTRLTLKSLMILITGSMLSTVVMANDDVFSFASVGISELNSNMFESADNINFSYSPSITVGVAKNYLLDDDWLLTNSIGIGGQQASFYSVNMAEVKEYGEVKKVGLIAGARLHYLGLSDVVMPFVEMEVGINNTSLSHQNDNTSQWQTDYKVATGLEFMTSNDASFSLSVGYSDNAGNKFNNP